MNIEGKTLRMLLRNGGIAWEFAGHGQGLVKDEELGVRSRRSKSPRRCSRVEPHPGVPASRHIWRFQVAKLSQEWFVNKVGTYGMARAQLYWGRMEALLLRLLYSLFPSSLMTSFGSLQSGNRGCWGRQFFSPCLLWEPR